MALAFGIIIYSAGVITGMILAMALFKIAVR